MCDFQKNIPFCYLVTHWKYIPNRKLYQLIDIAVFFFIDTKLQNNILFIGYIQNHIHIHHRKTDQNVINQKMSYTHIKLFDFKKSYKRKFNCFAMNNNTCLTSL